MQQTSKICHTRRILPQTLGRLSNGFVAPQVRIRDARQRSENGDEHRREENGSLRLFSLASVTPYDDGDVPAGCRDAMRRPSFSCCGS